MKAAGRGPDGVRRLRQRGRLIGAIHDICHDQWWGGRPVAAADISAVAVLPEARGAGAARAMLKAVLEGAYERGAAVSALYPTARRSTARAAGRPAASCARRTADRGAGHGAGAEAAAGRTLTVRPADPSGADQPAVCDLYTRVARPREGLLTRPRRRFAQTTWPKGIDGMTLAFDGETLVGYASWSRGTGYRVRSGAGRAGSAGRLDGCRARVARRARRLAQRDPDRAAAAAGLRPDHPAAPVGGRPPSSTPGRGCIDRSTWRGRWQPRLAAEPARPGDVPPARPVASWNDGAWQFDVADGHGELVRTGTHPELRLHVAGFALLYCGIATPAMLAEAGLLHGPDSSINGLELIRPKSAAQLLDYF